MKNFATSLDVPKMKQAVVTTVQTESTLVIKKSKSRTHLTTDAEGWDWGQLRDYVVTQIEQRQGAFPRERPEKEYGIFHGFLARWGDQAIVITKYAFEICDGIWMGAPISMYRFCKNSDPYFAERIVARLTQGSSAIN